MGCLIFQKAAVEIAKEFGYVEAANEIENLPSVPAVPLEPLCEWLSESFINIPCESCQHFANQYCTAIGDMSKPCPRTKDGWRGAITKWMEGLDAAD